MTPSHPLGTGPARSAHAALRAERVQVARWRRLVRARMDLAVAALAPPAELGDGAVGIAPADRDLLPGHLSLLDAVSAGGPVGEVDRLEALRALDLRLARYEHVVVQALLDVGAGIVARPTGPPTRVPAAHRPGPGPMGQTVRGRDPRHS